MSVSSRRYAHFRIYDLLEKANCDWYPRAMDFGIYQFRSQTHRRHGVISRRDRSQSPRVSACDADWNRRVHRTVDQELPKAFCIFCFSLPIEGTQVFELAKKRIHEWYPQKWKFKRRTLAGRVFHMRGLLIPHPVRGKMKTPHYFENFPASFLFSDGPSLQPYCNVTTK